MRRRTRNTAADGSVSPADPSADAGCWLAGHCGRWRLLGVEPGGAGPVGVDPGWIDTAPPPYFDRW
jgi:hypothetical protein